VYTRPATTFVAEFIGTPAICWLDAQLEPRGDGALRVAGRDWAVEIPARGELCSGPVRVGVRPPDWRLPASPGACDLEARVDLIEPLGPSVLVHAERLCGERLRWLAPADCVLQVGDPLQLCLPGGERLHLFDPESGLRLEL